MTFLHARSVFFFFLNPLNCPLIRIIGEETEYPGNHAETAGTDEKASSDLSEKNRAALPRVEKYVTFGYLGLEG